MLLKKDLLKTKEKISYFKLVDLLSLDRLLNSGIDLKNALFLLKTKQNKKLITDLLTKLDRGLAVNEVFPAYLRPELRSYYLALAPYLGLREDLHLCLRLFEEKRELARAVQKALAYPLGLLFISLAGVYLFNAYCFEALLGAFAAMNTNLAGLNVFRDVLDIMISIIFAFTALILLLILYFTRPKRQVFAYVFLLKHFSFSVLKDYFTNEFMIYFRECQLLGIKTYDTINILKRLKDKPLIAHLAKEVDKALLKGSDLKEALSLPIIDERLVYFIKIATNIKNGQEMIKFYLADFKRRFRNLCLKVAKGLQLLAYALIGLLIIFVYQILFIPMSMLGGL